VNAGSKVPVGKVEERRKGRFKLTENAKRLPGAFLFFLLDIAFRLRESKNQAYRLACRMKLSLLLLALLVAASHLGCAHKPPPPPPPPPSPPPSTVVERPKAVLRRGDWIIRNCARSDEKICYCHAPAERIDANGQQQHTVIECR
jgi:hypothetical protein